METIDPSQLSPDSKAIHDHEMDRSRRQFLLEWYQKFHENHHVLRSLHGFNKLDCLYNERYIAMLMHLAVPSEFDTILSEEGPYDSYDEEEIKQMWVESFDKIDTRTINMRFLSQLKMFFNDKGLDLTPILKTIFQAFNMKEKSVTVDFEGSYW